MPQLRKQVSIPKRVLEALNPFTSSAIAKLKATKSVSIPKRVLEALNLTSSAIAKLKATKSVSIPKRVLEALNPKATNGTQSQSMFQSLKGFWRL